MTSPLVSIITVNLNGERYLMGLLASLEHQTHPRTEILLVDNGSTDGSLALVRDHFPGVRVIEAGENLGFTGGNNLGFRKSRGEYLALINNDCVVPPDWLHRLVAVAEADPSIAGVGSKILFAKPFVAVRLRLVDRPGSGLAGDQRRPVIGRSSGFEECDYRKPVLKQGFCGPRSRRGEIGHAMTAEEATVFLPCEPATEVGDLQLRLWSEPDGDPEGSPRSLEVAVGTPERPVPVARLKPVPGWADYRVRVPAELLRGAAFDVINNAASFLEPDGRAGDRGIFEPDRGQFDHAEEVTALCGCSMLLRRQALERVGFFDRDLFMYYEDTELSWRLRDAGYRLWYEPASRVRHFHAATSGERSSFFEFLVGRNRVLMLIRHGAWRHVARAWLEEVYRCLRWLGRLHRPWREPLRTRLRIQLSLLWRGPRMALKRWGLLRP